MGALPLDELSDRYYAGAFQPRCGVTQRMFDWNRSCAEAGTVMGFSVPELNTYNPETGAIMVEFITPEGRRTCEAREPRRYVGTCSAGLECTVGGECVALRATGPQVQKLVPSSPFISVAATKPTALIPGLWLCTRDSPFAFVSALLHPVGLLVLLGVWASLKGTRRVRLATLAWRLLIALSLAAFVLVALSLLLGLISNVGEFNPTPWIHAFQYAAVALAWATVVILVWRYVGGSSRHPRSNPESRRWVDFGIVVFQQVLIGGVHVAIALCLWGSIVWLGFGKAVLLACVTSPVVLAFDIWLARLPRAYDAPVERRQGMAIPAAIVLGIASVIGIWFVEPRISRDSLLSVPLWPYRFARYALHVYASPVATDECLARTVVHYGAWTSRGTGLGSDIAAYIARAPARSADDVLLRRRETAIRGTAGVLADVLESGTRDEQRAAVDLLKRVAYRGGIQPVLIAWAESPAKPEGQNYARAWLACLRKGRRDYIYKDGIDQSCELRPSDSLNRGSSRPQEGK